MRYIFLGLFISQLLTANLFAITIGIVPQQSPFQLMKVWNPIIKYLENETGEKVSLKLVYSFSKFESELYGGKYDIAYMNPYHYVIPFKINNIIL
jgi:phosphonate transport system substrate-binding protein